MGKQPYVNLFNGQKMPLVGLGTWQATNPAELEEALHAALKAGYRHFDTAYLYENEEIIGKVLKAWISSGRITRDDLFIVTKLPPIGNRPEHVPHFLNKSLKSLKLDYVDLYLIHMPFGITYINDTELWPMTENGKVNVDMSTNLEEIWEAMELQVKKGFTKSIGISNFSISQMERIVKVAKIQPANHQVELHAYYQQKDLQKACKKHNITLCAYAPIGSPGRKELFAAQGKTFVPLTLMEDPLVLEIAKAHNKTPSQVLLRFLTQQNIIVIPKSTNEDRLRNNLQILDFELNAFEMRRLEFLDKGKAGKSFTFEIFPGIKDHPECPV